MTKTDVLLPSPAIAPLLELTDFLSARFDPICLGDTDHADPTSDAIITDVRFIEGLAGQKFTDIFLERCRSLQKTIRAVREGRAGEQEKASLAKTASCWLPAAQRELLARRLVQNVEKGRLYFHAIDTRPTEIKTRMPILMKSLLWAGSLFMPSFQVFAPQNKNLVRPYHVALAAVSALSRAAREILYDDKKTAQLVAKKRMGPSLVVYGADHFSARNRLYGTDSLLDALRDQGMNPVTINVFSSLAQREAYHSRAAQTIPGFRPAPIDYIAASSARDTRILFNGPMPLKKSFELFRAERRRAAMKRAVA